MLLCFKSEKGNDDSSNSDDNESDDCFFFCLFLDFSILVIIFNSILFIL